MGEKHISGKDEKEGLGNLVTNCLATGPALMGRRRQPRQRIQMYERQKPAAPTLRSGSKPHGDPRLELL